MRFKLMIAGFGILTFCTFLYAGWNLQHTGTNQLSDIEFPPANLNIGYACGVNSFFLKTTNGGSEWNPLTTVPPSGDYHAINFPVDSFIGYLACDSGNVYLTRDGGTSWRPTYVGRNISLYGIHFPKNNDTGYVVGMEGFIARTENSGRDWFNLSYPLPQNLYAVYFVNTRIGWVVGDNGTILNTHNEGIDWAIQTSGVTEQLLSIQFRDTLHGWVVGSNNTVLKTENGGTSWEPITVQFPRNTNLYSVTFSNDMTKGFICGSFGRIARTVNSGNSWDTTTVSSADDLYGVRFPVAQSFLTGWVCGWNEAIYKTTDGGSTWLEEKKPVGIALTSNFTCSPNPFRTNTMIKYNPPLTSMAMLKIYDCSGGLVRSLAFDDRGIANWDGWNELQRRVKSGVYLVELIHNGVAQRQKLILLE